MIAKDCGTGKSFIGLGAYLATGKGGEDPERVLWSHGINLPSDDIKAGAAIMRSHANENTRVEKPVYHFSIAWHPSEFDGTDQAKALAIVSETLNDLGLSDHQALAIAHRDTEHFHVHVMVNRINPETGKSWKQGLSMIALENIMADLSLAHGFEVVPGRHNARDLGLEPIEPDLSAPSEVQRFEDRTGADSALTRAREDLAEPVRAATSWKDLEQLLAPLGYEVQARGRGLVFTSPEGVSIKASAVDRDFSRAALAERFGEDLAEHRGTAVNENAPAPAPKVAPTFEDRAAKDASPLLTAARSWSELDKGLYQVGYVIQPKGRGLVLTDGADEIKLSSLSRQFSKHALEARFGESFQHHAATAERPRVCEPPSWRPL